MSVYITSAEAAGRLGISEESLFHKSDVVGGPLPSVATPSGRVYLAEDVEAYRTGTMESSSMLPLSAEQWLQPYSESCFSEATTAVGSGVIRNVLICGNRSRNGYSIPPAAFGGEANTRKLYEGQPVFIDHGERGRELARSVKEMAGVIQNVRLVGGTPRGDIDTEGYICGATLLGIAKARPPQVGLSHVASYRMSRDRKTVERIEEVVSVDVVFRPATTTTFYERDTMETRELCEPAPMILAGTGPGLQFGS